MIIIFFTAKRNIKNSRMTGFGYERIIQIIGALYQQILKKLPSKKH